MKSKLSKLHIEDLLHYLRRSGPVKAAAICSHFDISQSTLSRWMARDAAGIMMWGRGRARRYAARRHIDKVAAAVPVYEIDQRGGARHFGTLHPIYPQGFIFECHESSGMDAHFDDLPWFLQDSRPQGFLGRLLPHQHPELAVPRDIRLWTADHCLRYFTHLNWNPIGAFIVGEPAFSLYLQQSRQPTDVLFADQVPATYPERAERVMSQGDAGSSAGGEQPKFLATILDSKPRAVIVKFSPPILDNASRRMADLLICEHLAHRILASYELPSAHSQIYHHENRMFLEVQRFDRTSQGGRRGLVLLATLDALHTGLLEGWGEIAHKLHERAIISATSLYLVRQLECFGGLIANSDMHCGNLSFYLRGLSLQGLAPCYDMLPMAYAPRQGHLLSYEFTPPLPKPSDADILPTASSAAIDFWTLVAEHPLVSTDFRAIATENRAKVKEYGLLINKLPHQK